MIDLRDLKTQAVLGGAAVLLALVYVLGSLRPDPAPGSGGGPLLVPVPSDLRRRLESGTRDHRHPRESGIIQGVQKKLGVLPDDQRMAAFRSMPRGARYIWTTFWVEAEVKNGGFDQYFLNGCGPFAADAAEAFRAMGVEAAARLVEQAVEIHRQEAKDQSRPNPRFEPLDEAFYKLDDDNPVEKLRARYIDAHPGDF